MDEATHILCGNIRRMAKGKKIKLRHIGDELGIGKERMSDLLNGRKVFRAEYLPKIAEVLGVDISELFRE